MKIAKTTDTPPWRDRYSDLPTLSPLPLLLLLLSGLICRIMFKIFDGMFWSDPAYVTVSIRPINDNAPELSLMPLGVAYTEETPGGVRLLSDVMLVDIDHNNAFNLTALHVSLCSEKGKKDAKFEKIYSLFMNTASDYMVNHECQGLALKVKPPTG